MNVTDKKLEANRRNAEKSTGPKTRVGKNWARMNSLKHGFFAKSLHFESSDDESEYYELEEGIQNSLSPLGTLEELEAQRIALLAWNERRLIQLIERQLAEYERPKLDPQLQQFIAASQFRDVSLPGVPETEDELSAGYSPWERRELVATIRTDQLESKRSEDPSGFDGKKRDLDTNSENSGYYVEVRLGQALQTLHARLASIERSYERAVNRFQRLKQIRRSLPSKI